MEKTQLFWTVYFIGERNYYPDSLCVNPKERSNYSKGHLTAYFLANKWIPDVRSKKYSILTKSYFYIKWKQQ